MKPQGLFRKLSHSELVDRQTRFSLPKIPLTVIVNNVRSLYNVGSIFRTADGVGVEKIWLCGITGIPPSPKISKTALDADRVVPWEYAEDAGTVAAAMRDKGYDILLLEQTAKSIPYYEFKPSRPSCLILGNEISGVGDSLLDGCDYALEIDMAGLKNSLNVTVAFGVVAYHLRTRYLAGN